MATLGLLALAAIGATRAYVKGQPSAGAGIAVTAQRDSSTADAGLDPDLDAIDASFTSGRPVYKHSVIPGGAYDADELLSAIERDAVVAGHYKDVDTSRIRAEVVPHDRFVHVSYRKGNDVFWTKKKVLLRRGETILTDGKTQIRARCGNCIAEELLGPTERQEEPETVEFDRLVDAPASDPAATPPTAVVVGRAQHSLPATMPGNALGVGRLTAPAGAGTSPGAPVPGGIGGANGTEVPLVRATPATHQPPSANQGGNSTGNVGANSDGDPGGNPTEGGDAPPNADDWLPTLSELPGSNLTDFPGGNLTDLPGGNLTDLPGGNLTHLLTGSDNPGTPGTGTPGSGNPGLTSEGFQEVAPPGGAPASPTPVPEPGTILLFGTGVATLLRKLHSRNSPL